MSTRGPTISELAARWRTAPDHEKLNAANELCAAILRTAFSVALKMGVEHDIASDIAQNTALRVFHGLEGIKAGREEAYTVIATRNQVKDAFQHRGRNVYGGSLEDFEDALASSPDFEDDQDVQAAFQALSDRLTKLGERLTPILKLALRGLSQKDIAHIFGVSPAAISKDVAQIREVATAMLQEFTEPSVRAAILSFDDDDPPPRDGGTGGRKPKRGHGSFLSTKTSQRYTRG